MLRYSTRIIYTSAYSSSDQNVMNKQYRIEIFRRDNSIFSNNNRLITTKKR
jgi:hypothetical protein